MLHEYCRLEALVEKHLGKDRLAELRQAWLTDPASSPCGCLLGVRAWGDAAPRAELIGVQVTLIVKVAADVAFETTRETRFTASPFLPADKPRAEAPREWTDRDGKKWTFSHWELGYRDAFGFLARLATSRDNPWSVPLQCKPGLTLDAIYVPAVVEEAPLYTPEPPGGEIEPPPGG